MYISKNQYAHAFAYRYCLNIFEYQDHQRHPNWFLKNRVPKGSQMEDPLTLDLWEETIMIIHLILIMYGWFLKELRVFFLFPFHHLSHPSTPPQLWHRPARHWGPSWSLSPIGQLRHPGARGAPLQERTTRILKNYIQ